MNALIKGIIAAMVTAMNEDESLHEAEIRRQVNRQIAAGANAVFCLGTTGEAYIQSEAEKLEVMRIVVDEGEAVGHAVVRHVRVILLVHALQAAPQLVGRFLVVGRDHRHPQRLGHRVSF